MIHARTVDSPVFVIEAIKRNTVDTRAVLFSLMRGYPEGGVGIEECLTQAVSPGGKDRTDPDSPRVPSSVSPTNHAIGGHQHSNPPSIVTCRSAEKNRLYTVVARPTVIPARRISPTDSTDWADTSPLGAIRLLDLRAGIKVGVIDAEAFEKWRILDCDRLNHHAELHFTVTSVTPITHGGHRLGGRNRPEDASSLAAF